MRVTFCTPNAFADTPGEVAWRKGRDGAPKGAGKAAASPGPAGAPKCKIRTSEKAVCVTGCFAPSSHRKWSR